MSLDLTDGNIVSGNGLVPLGNTPLPDPVLIHFYGATRPQWVNPLQKYIYI